MGVPKLSKASLTVKDGRFRLVVVNEELVEVKKSATGEILKTKTKLRKSIRYPKIQILKNRVRVGCITVSREAARKLFNAEEGYLQAEGQV
jgi:hypothetical protein